MFQQVKLGSVKYITFVVFLPLLYYKLYSKDNFKNFIVRLFQSKISKIYFILLIYFALYALNNDTEYEYDYLIKFFFPGTVFFILTLYFFNNLKIYKEVILGLIIFSTLTLLFIILFKGFLYITTYERGEISENIGMGPIAQGRMAGLMGLTSLVLFFNLKKRLHKYLFLGIFILSLIWLTMTGTRGALLAMILTFFIYMFFNKNSKRIFVTFLLLIPILVVFIYYSGALDSVLFERLSLLTEDGGIQSMERYRRYIIFFNMPFEKFIFGLGPGGWGKYINNELYTFPHNIVLESIIEYGLVGLFFILSVLISGAYTVLKVLRDRESNLYLIIICLCWVYYAGVTMVSGSYIKGNVNFFTFTAVLICVRYALKYQRSRS